VREALPCVTRVAYDSCVDSETAVVDATVMQAQLRLGKVLRGKLRLDALLGVGGMAAVYAATHRNGSRVAVKILHPELGGQPHLRSRFLKEGYAANRVDHGGVVRVIDDDEAEDGSLFLVMELLDGESLDARAARGGGALPADEVLAIADQVLDVLDAAQEKGIVHRDLKPENVFLTRDGTVKVLDFGIARLRELSSGSGATQVGTIMGTPTYMPPEQARGLWKDVDARSDIWAIGATMFALLTGEPVHSGRTPNEILLAAMSHRAPPVRDRRPGISDATAQVVDRALAFEKEARWPRARTMQDAVRHAYHALYDTPISSHPPITVPDTVPNRTLASAEVDANVQRAATTGPALVSGRTGVALRSERRDVRSNIFVVAAAGVALIVLMATVVVVASMISRSATSPPASSDLTSAGSLPNLPSVAAGMSREADAHTPAASASSASAPVVTPEDLPSGLPEATTAKPRQSKPSPQPTPTPPKRSEGDWKDRRQ
jgi:eukaryotic-like serine/threonine-protein kinase